MLATLPHIKGGRIRGIAVASPKRMPAAPELPTMIESGVPGFVTGTWQGLLAPAGTPKDIIAKLHAAVVQIVTSPEMKQQLASQGAEVIADTPEQFAAFLREDTMKWAKIAKETGIKAE